MLPLIVGSIAGGGLICVLYGALIERSWYRLRRYRLPILPAGSVAEVEGAPATLTILHLSDLHFVRRDPRKARFLASLPPADVTVVTGDFLAEPEAIDTVVEAVRPVRGKLASWFVLGSNDYFAPRPLNYLAYFRKTRKRRWARPGRVRELIGKLTAEGWIDLTDERRSIELGSLPVELVGLDDAHLRWQDFRTARRLAPERFGIAVMHSPDSAPEAAALGYELMVAGHTHGGQVRLPFVGALVTNCSMPRRLASGLIRMGSATLHTSPGLGTSKYAPFRFWCRPEATILELTQAPTEAAAPSLSEATSLH